MVAGMLRLRLSDNANFKNVDNYIMLEIKGNIGKPQDVKVINALLLLFQGGLEQKALTLTEEMKKYLPKLTPSYNGCEEGKGGRDLVLGFVWPKEIAQNSILQKDEDLQQAIGSMAHQFEKIIEEQTEKYGILNFSRQYSSFFGEFRMDSSTQFFISIKALHKKAVLKDDKPYDVEKLKEMINVARSHGTYSPPPCQDSIKTGLS